MEHYAERRGNRQHRGIDDAVRDVDEFNLERSDGHALPRANRVQSDRTKQSVLFELLFDQGQRKRSAIDGDVQVGQEIRHSPDVVLMPVREDQGADLPAVFQ